MHDRAVEDKFYRDLLGFRPYWWGGRGNNPVEWVSQQVPDGHDWLEYMLAAGPGSGVPAGMTQQTLGVLDHFSVGEVSIPNAYKVLQAGDRLTGKHDQGPKIGLDGKYQFLSLIHICGYADQMLRVKNNPYDPSNRRISILVKNGINGAPPLPKGAVADGAPANADAKAAPAAVAAPGPPPAATPAAASSGATPAPPAKTGLMGKLTAMLPGKKK